MKKICHAILGLGLLFGLSLASCLPPTAEPTPTPSPTSTIVPSPTLTPTFTPVVTTISIRSPVDGGQVGMRTTIEGTSQNLPDGSVIWIVIYLPSVNRYFPTNNPALVQANGEWSSLAQFGLEGESGLRADITAVLADDNIQSAFKAYLTTASNTGNYEGMDGLPEGALVYDRISVIRGDGILVTPGGPKFTPTSTILVQTPNFAQLLQVAFKEIDDQLKESLKSNIAYNAPQTMNLDSTVTVELLINPSFSQARLATQVVERGEQRGEYVTSTAEPGKLVPKQGGEVIIITSEIQITDRMKAVLTSKDPDSFVIQKLHDSEEQPISSIDTTIWRWDVTAKKGGIQALELVIYRLVKYEGKDNWRLVDTYRADIVVTVTFWQLLRLLGLDWKWIQWFLGILVTLLLIPAFWRWIDGRKRKSAEQENSLSPKKRYKS